MAQLRDKETSELLFDGTPLEVSALAEAIGLSEVMFDGVGWDHEVGHEEEVPEGSGSSPFDHQAVLDSAIENRDGLKEVEGEDIAVKVKSIDAKLRPSKELVDEIKAKMKEARSRVG